MQLVRASYQATPLVDTPGDGRIDANEPHHAIHQFDLMKNPVEHRPAVAEIAHVTPRPTLINRAVSIQGRE